MDDLSPAPGPPAHAAPWPSSGPPPGWPQESQEEALRSPVTGWPSWTAPVALVFGVFLAAVAALVVDLPALALGVNITSSHLPGGLVILDTVVQDGAFVFAAVFFARLGGVRVWAWQFGLRPTRFRRAVGLLVLMLVSYLLLSAVWVEVFHPAKEKTLEQLGADEGTTLLLLSAALTCVLAPICEEFLFRGFIFTALRNWRGTWPAAIITGVLFGGVHAFSAPAVDLVPLAGLGVGLCLLYRSTGSLYPCIVAHSLNNSLAFGSLEGWGWQTLTLMVTALAVIGLLVLALIRLRVITPEPSTAVSGSSAVATGG